MLHFLPSFKSFGSFFVASISLLRTSPFIPRVLAHTFWVTVTVELLIFIFVNFILNVQMRHSLSKTDFLIISVSLLSYSRSYP